MKICVLGIDGVTPEAIFEDDRLANLRRLMDVGTYGRLQNVIPPCAVPAWICMATSQDPGSLGVYGLRNRRDHTYQRPVLAGSDIHAAIWDDLSGEGKRSIVVGVPPDYPPRKIKGISIGCFFTPDLAHGECIWPEEIRARIAELIGNVAVDVPSLPTGEDLRKDILAVSGKQWEVVRWLLREEPWDYFHFVDSTLARMRHMSSPATNSQPGISDRQAISECCLWLDEQIGSVLEGLESDTVVLVVALPQGQAAPGGFDLNQWLIREGLLVPSKSAAEPRQLDDMAIHWHQTRAWSDGNNVFLNLHGREPDGAIPAVEYEKLRDEIKARLEALRDDQSQFPLEVFKPREIYRSLEGIAPDLIACSGGVQKRSGAFVLAAPNCPLTGEYDRAHLLDLAPTLLDLAGHKVPDAMQGRSLVAGLGRNTSGDGSSHAEGEKIIRDRLAGLGYV